LAKLNGAKATWAYNSTLWTSTSTLNSSSLLIDQTEAKLAAFNLFPVASLRLGLVGGGSRATQWLNLDLRGRHASLAAAFSGGVIATGLGRAAWMAWAGAGATLAPFCSKEGLNVNPQPRGHAAARLGLVAGSERNCSRPTSAIGLGLLGGAGVYAGENGDGSGPIFAYILGTEYGLKSPPPAPKPPPFPHPPPQPHLAVHSTYRPPPAPHVTRKVAL